MSIEICVLQLINKFPLDYQFDHKTVADNLSAFGYIIISRRFITLLNWVDDKLERNFVTNSGNKFA